MVNYKEKTIKIRTKSNQIEDELNPKRFNKLLVE